MYTRSSSKRILRSRTRKVENTTPVVPRRSQRLRNQRLIKIQNNSSTNISKSTYHSPYTSPAKKNILKFNRCQYSKKRSTKIESDDTFAMNKEYKRMSSFNSNKRRMSDESKKNGSPPPNKRNTKTVNSPSRILANSVSRLSITKQDTEYYTSDEKAEEYKHISENRNQSRIQNILQVQQLLLTQDMANQQLKGRETEYATIQSFITSNLHKRQGNSLYICGSPGTGKTATILKIEQYLLQYKQSLNIANVIKLNAMHFHKPIEIYSALHQKICNGYQISPCLAMDELNDILFDHTSNHKMYVVIIDECDGLLNKQQTILNRLFLWCKKQRSKLILIGIANTVDLMDRFLPRLRARNCEPQLLIFKPYTKQQLLNILEYRLSLNTNGYVYFESIALEVCAQKVAKMYGDLRKCLEICRTALHVLIDDGNKHKIGFLEMSQVLKDSFASPVIEVIRELPNHQKILIVIASIMCSKCRWMTDMNLHLFYNYVVGRFSLPKCHSNDYSLVMESLVADGILKITYERQQTVGKKVKKLQTCVPLHVVQYAVQNHKILSKLFDANFMIPHKFLN